MKTSEELDSAIDEMRGKTTRTPVYILLLELKALRDGAAVSFDEDGYRTQYIEALPSLKNMDSVRDWAQQYFLEYLATYQKEGTE